MKLVIKEFGRDKAGTLSSAFAYTAVFAIGPLLLIFVSIVGFVYGDRAAKGELVSSLQDFMGPSAAQTIQSVVAHTHQYGSGALALVIGIIGVLLAAAALANQLQKSFDIIFDVVPDPKAGIKRTIYVKLKNIAVVISGAVIAAASLVVSSIILGLSHSIQTQIEAPSVFMEIINEVASVAIFTLILYFIYRVLPDIIIPRKLALSVAVIISLLFWISKFILGFVISHNGTTSAYGAAASVIALLLWFYYSAQIILLGAEGLKVYADDHIIIFRPKKYTLKRHTLNVDTNSFVGRAIQAFSLGYKQESRRQKK